MTEQLERRLQRGLDDGDVMPVLVMEAADTLKRYREALEQAYKALKPFAGHVGKRGESITITWGKDTWTHTLKDVHFYDASSAARAARTALSDS